MTAWFSRPQASCRRRPYRRGGGSVSGFGRWWGVGRRVAPAHLRRARIMRWFRRRPGGLLAAVGISMSAGLVLNLAGAAFTANTGNSGNSVAAGAVALSDDDLSTAAFSVSGLTPGTTRVKCIVVSY